MKTIALLMSIWLLQSSTTYAQNTFFYSPGNLNESKESDIQAVKRNYLFFDQALNDKKLTIKLEGEKPEYLLVKDLNVKQENGEDYKFIVINDKQIIYGDKKIKIGKSKLLTVEIENKVSRYNLIFPEADGKKGETDIPSPVISVNVFDTVKPGEIIFYDALYLVDKYKLKISALDKMLLLKNNYGINRSDLDNHPFLYGLKKTFPEQQNSDVQRKFNNVLKTDVTNFATGMSRFLLERAKQELNESFFSTMYRQMNKLPELQYFFPESFYALKQLNENNLQINLEQLKSKFENDVRQFPVNLYAARNMNVPNNYKIIPQWNHFLNSTVQGKWIDAGLFTMMQSDWKVNPKDLFYNFVHSEARYNLEELLNVRLATDPTGIFKKQLNLLNTIKLSELISSSLLSGEKDQYWITEEQFQQLFSDNQLFETYIGLLIAKSKFKNYEIGFNDNSGGRDSLAGLLNPLYGKDYATLKSFLRDLYKSFNEVDRVVQRLKTDPDSENQIDNSYKLYSVFKETIQTTSAYVRYGSVFGSGNNFAVDQDVLYKYITPCIDIAYHMKAKKYNLAINDFLLLLEEVNEKYERKDRKEKKEKKEKKEFSKPLAQFVRYGTLIANVATAEGSDQVKAAIESSVLPVGSSRIKRHSTCSISLNAYVGGFYGPAFYKETINNQVYRRSINSYGITAPIGISVNWGNIGWQKNKSAFSITGQLIDLGALVNFYQKNGDGASLPADTKIHLGDILAPGFQLSWSLGNLPISAISGIQYVPNLSRIPDLQSSSNFVPVAWRIQAGIVVDIPLFNLKVWTK